LRLTQEWAALHRDEHRRNWIRAREDAPLERIAPLPSIDAVEFAAHLRRVVAVQVVGEHRLRVAFDDGLGGEIDASDWAWRGVFEPLRDPTYFARVELDRELGTIRWPNGADVAPETLHSWVAEAPERQSA